MHTTQGKMCRSSVLPQSNACFQKRNSRRCRLNKKINATATPSEAAPSAEAAPAKARKPSPLEAGGSLKNSATKTEGPAAITKKAGKVKQICQIEDGKFVDYRWVDGTWNFAEFSDGKGGTDWDAVIDAEMQRRRLLEDTPIDSIYGAPVNFDTQSIPWWAWVRRFHLPEAEKLNGRAAMVGYAMAWFVDSLSGAGLVDQQNSFLGKLLLHVAVFGILIFRSNDVIPKFKNLFDEATFYDKQWKATWEGQKRPSETES
jgi:hypothetical protein